MFAHVIVAPGGDYDDVAFYQLPGIAWEVADNPLWTINDVGTLTI